VTCTSHVASKLEELIIVDSSTKRNKKEMSESSTQNRGVEYMFWRPKHASFDREDMRNNGKSYQRSLTERSQLDPIDMENTRGIANVRIHLKRVIGLLQKKLTTDVLMSNKEQQKAMLLLNSGNK